MVGVIGQRGPAYRQTWQGVREALLRADPDLRIDLLELDADPARLAERYRSLGPEPPGAVVAVGSAAVERMAALEQSAPIVACMVLNAGDIPRGRNLTGVYLEYPMAQQFEFLRRMLPNQRSVGVIYSSQENHARIGAARAAALEQGLELVSIRVTEARQLPEALDEIAKRTGVLWGWPDDLVLNVRTAKLILLFSYRNRVPLVGLSSAWVKAGALYALDWDFTDLGRQCADQVGQILAGVSPQSIEPGSPRRMNFSLNQRAMRHLKLEVPRELLIEASRLYGEQGP